MRWGCPWPTPFHLSANGRREEGTNVPMPSARGAVCTLRLKPWAETIRDEPSSRYMSLLGLQAGSGETS